jgi:hypothetical protein
MTFSHALFQGTSISTFLHTISSKWPLLVELSLDGFYIMADADMTSISQCFPRLKSLSFRNSFMTVPALQVLTRANFSNLCNLDLSLRELWLPPPVTNVTNADILRFIDCFGVQLSSLKLDNRNLTDSVIDMIVQRCDSVETLHLGGSSLVSQAALLRLVESNMSLTSLDLSGKIGSTWNRESREFEMSHAVLPLSNVTDEVSFALAKRHRGLRELFLAGSKITDAGVERLVKGCPQLTRIDVSFTCCTDATLAHVATNCKQLRYFTAKRIVRSKQASDQFASKMKSFCSIEW